MATRVQQTFTEFFYFYFSIHYFLRRAFLFHSYAIVTRIRGNIVGSSPPSALSHTRHSYRKKRIRTDIHRNNYRSPSGGATVIS